MASCSRRRPASPVLAATWRSPAPTTIPAPSSPLPPQTPQSARDDGPPDGAGGWGSGRRLWAGGGQPKPIARPARGGGGDCDPPPAPISALCDRTEWRFAEAHRGFHGPRLGVVAL